MLARVSGGRKEGKEVVTKTRNTRTKKSRVASAHKRSRSVNTGSIETAVIGPQEALIDVWRFEMSSYE